MRAKASAGSAKDEAFQLLRKSIEICSGSSIMLYCGSKSNYSAGKAETPIF
jgi:hypothetical protein